MLPDCFAAKLQSWASFRSLKITVLLLASILVSSCSNREAGISIDPLRHFAHTYNPYSEGDGLCEGTPSVPTVVERVLEDRRIDKNFKKYVAIIFLKLYNCQFDKYGQSVRVPPGPLYKAYRGVMGDVSREFVSSADVLVWLKLNKEMMKDHEIKALVEQTRALHERMGVDDDWLPE